MKKAFMNAKNEAKDLNLPSSFGKIKCQEYWNRWDSLVLKHLGITENVTLAKTVQSKWFDFVDCTLYPEVKNVLSELKQRGLKTGIISTAYEEEIQFILEKADLKKTTFDMIVGVDTIRKAKPNPDIFKYALSKLDVTPEDAIFVGDNIDMDYKPSEDIGMRAVLIRRKGGNPKNRKIRSIRDLQEIFRFIDQN